MIHEPPIDKLVEEVEGCRYALCCLASKRARQIIDADLAEGNLEPGDKPISIAAKEIYEGKLTFNKD